MAPIRCREPERGSTQQQPAHPSEAENVFQQRLGRMSGLSEVHVRAGGPHVILLAHYHYYHHYYNIIIIIIICKAVFHTVLALFLCILSLFAKKSRVIPKRNDQEFFGAEERFG